MKALLRFGFWFTATCLLFSSITAFADSSTTTEESANYVIAYACVPIKIWDTGYHLQIAFDRVHGKYVAFVSSVTFVGETPLFNAAMNMSLAGGGPLGPHSLLFTEEVQNPPNSITFKDLGHRIFKMRLIVDGKQVDPAFENLDCQMAGWLGRAYP